MNALERLQKILKQDGRIRELHKLTGVSDPKLRQWGGGADPKVSSIEPLFTKGKLSPNYIFTGEGPEFVKEENGRIKNGLVIGEIKTNGYKGEILDWVAEQDDEILAWATIKRAMIGQISDFNEWQKKRREHGGNYTSSSVKSVNG